MQHVLLVQLVQRQNRNKGVAFFLFLTSGCLESEKHQNPARLRSIAVFFTFMGSHRSSFSLAGLGFWGLSPCSASWAWRGPLACSSSTSPPSSWRTCSPSSTPCKGCSSSSSTASSRKRWDVYQSLTPRAPSCVLTMSFYIWCVLHVWMMETFQKFYDAVPWHFRSSYVWQRLSVLPFRNIWAFPYRYSIWTAVSRVAFDKVWGPGSLLEVVCRRVCRCTHFLWSFPGP